MIIHLERVTHDTDKPVALYTVLYFKTSPNATLFVVIVNRTNHLTGFFFIVYSSADDEDSLDLPSFLEVMGRQNQAQTGQTAVGKCDQLLTFLNHSVVIFNEAGHEKTGLDHSKYPKLYNLSVKLFQCHKP